MEGYIKLHRKLLESSVFASDKCLKVFIWCLLKSTYIQRKVMVGMQTVELQPGQFITGRKRAAEELDIPEGTVYDIMTTLKCQQLIDIKPNNRFSVVTVTNWTLYQIEDDESNNKNSVASTANQQQTNTNKKDKNIDPITPTGATPKTELEREWELYYIKLNAYLEAKKSGSTMAYPEPPKGGRPDDKVSSG